MVTDTLNTGRPVLTTGASQDWRDHKSDVVWTACFRQAQASLIFTPSHEAPESGTRHISETLRTSGRTTRLVSSLSPRLPAVVAGVLSFVFVDDILICSVSWHGQYVQIKKKATIHLSWFLTLRDFRVFPQSHEKEEMQKFEVHYGGRREGSKEESTWESEMSTDLNPFTKRHLMYFLNKALIRVTNPLCSTFYTAHK